MVAEDEANEIEEAIFAPSGSVLCSPVRGAGEEELKGDLAFEFGWGVVSQSLCIEERCKRERVGEMGCVIKEEEDEGGGEKSRWGDNWGGKLKKDCKDTLRDNTYQLLEFSL